jgi:ArsR family transcriptional regulator
MSEATCGKLSAELVFRALSDQTRLRIVQLLQERELCVGELVELLDVPQPTASRHLAYLRRARLVAVRKDGLWNYYRLASADTPFHARLLECVAACASKSPRRVRRANG